MVDAYFSMKFVLALGVLAVFVESLRYDLGDRLQNYNKNVPPAEPVEVEVGYYAWKFKIKDKNELEAGFYIRQQWHDNRLAGLNDTVSLYGEAFKTIWRPDLFLRDATLKVLDNGINVYHVTRVNTTGSVWHAIRSDRMRSRTIKLIASNDKRLFSLWSVDGIIPCYDWYLENHTVQYYNNHTEICSMKTESFGFTTNELTLTWLQHALEFDSEVNVGLPSHYVTNYSLENCAWTDSLGSYPCLDIRLKFDLFSMATGIQVTPAFLLAAMVIYATAV